MIDVGRNLLILLAAFVGAFLVSALGQAAFSFLFPMFSGRTLWQVDYATYFLFALDVPVYFIFGAVVPRLLRTAWPALWIMSPIVFSYGLAVAQPYPFRCNPFTVAGCWMIQAVFVVPAIAIVTGYLIRPRHRGERYVA